MDINEELLELINVEEYLDRLEIKDEEERKKIKQVKSIQVISLLQKKHLFVIPFENLDLHRGVRINISLEKSYNKIVKCELLSFTQNCLNFGY